MNEQTYFPIGSAAKMMNRSTKTLRRWHDSGKIEALAEEYTGWRLFSLETINKTRTKDELSPLTLTEANEIHDEHYAEREELRLRARVTRSKYG